MEITRLDQKNTDVRGKTMFNGGNKLSARLEKSSAVNGRNGTPK